MVADAMVRCTDRQTDDVGAGDKPYDAKEVGCPEKVLALIGQP